MNAENAAAIAPPEGRSGIGKMIRALFIGIAGLAYAFIVWTAVLYPIELSASTGLSGYGWFVLLLPAGVAALVFVVALAITKRRTLLTFLLVMAAGLGLSAVFLLDTFNYVLRNFDMIAGG